jgi:hypothetical protein
VKLWILTIYTISIASFVLWLRQRRANGSARPH